VLNDGFAGRRFPRGVQSEFSPEVIDWNQFRRFPIKGEDRAHFGPPVDGSPSFQTGVLLETFLSSIKSGKRRAGVEETWGRSSAPFRAKRFELRWIWWRIRAVPWRRGSGRGSDHGDAADGRDIAHYIAKLFGAMNEKGPRPFDAPVETIQREKGRVRFHVRLSAGILGLAEVPDGFACPVFPRESDRWWRRFSGARFLLKWPRFR
jgi:hypothetical protein